MFQKQLIETDMRESFSVIHYYWVGGVEDSINGSKLIYKLPYKSFPTPISNETSEFSKCSNAPVGAAAVN